MIRRLKRLARSAAASVIRFGLRSARMRALVSSEFGGRRPPPRSERSTPDGEFVDRHGVHHPLDSSLRDRLKPAWRTMFDLEVAMRTPTDEALAGRARKAEKIVEEASAFVATLTGLPLDGRILEVGCYDGAVAYQLAHRASTQVVASDLARYYLIQRPGVSSDADVGGQQQLLAEIRERARVLAGAAAGRVEFVEDDITDSGLPSASFDAIVSFEVLEHVQRPAAAFTGMARLLRPGGILYHDYNPFFSANGGHSLCTLDFPWGHARLDDEDFERYVRELRPPEVDQALRFYRESLNRMTLVDLRTAVTAAGLELLAVVPWSERGLVPRLDPDLLAEVRRIYPTAAVDDLLSTFVAAVARRPHTLDGSSRHGP